MYSGTNNYTAHTTTTMTGEQFNAQMGSTKMCKVLNWDLIHYGFVYKPNALNELIRFGEKFDPDPNCKPGGLYFCTEAEIFRFVSRVVGNPLIASVEIPADATVSVGEHKFKTDKLILGQPVTFEIFCSDEYVRNLSMDTVMSCYWGYQREWSVVKKLYLLAPDKFGSASKCIANLLFFAIKNCDIKFIKSIKEDFQKMLVDSQIKQLVIDHIRNMTTYLVLGREEIEWFRTNMPLHTDLLSALDDARFIYVHGRC